MIYTIYNPTTYDVLYAMDCDSQPFSSTDVVMTEAFVKPKFNPTTNTFYEGATPQEIYDADYRNNADYYNVREAAGKALVNEVANDLLVKYKSGEMTLMQVMDIEQALDTTMSALGRGQIISALYHIGNVSAIETELKASIMRKINELKVIHYA